MSDRHTFRADWHAYNDGVFFVTICAKDKQHFFGKITNGKINYSTTGNIINKCLLAIPHHHNDVELWSHIVMPNHIHMVLSISAAAAPAHHNQIHTNAPMHPTSSAPTPHTGCLKPPQHDDPRNENHFNSRLAVIIRSFKAACTAEVNQHRRAQNIAPLQIWQRNYHEHIIRNRRELGLIINYIDNNISTWTHDCYRNSL